MGTLAIKHTIAILTDQGIAPYDLLLALGKPDVVPDEIIKDRTERIVKREGKKSSQGYIRNAIEDLEKLSFDKKEEVLKTLRDSLGTKELGNFELIGTDSNQQAFNLLHLSFIVVPLLAGADKFFNWSTNWEKYVAPQVADAIPLSKRQLMRLAGGIEMIAGIVTALDPKIGGYLVSGWLALIVANLLISGENYDIALRDLGLALGALALARLAHGQAAKSSSTEGSLELVTA